MKRFSAALVLITVAAALWWVLGAAPAPDQPPRPGAPASAPRRRGDTAADARAGALVEALQRLNPPDRAPGPQSLRDTAVDGSLAVGDDGRLLVNPELRRFFEYFFSASGEQSDDVIRDRIRAAIDIVLTDEAAHEAHTLLDRYLQYRARGEALAATAPGDDLAARFDAVRRLRREVFGEADAAALFADEEAVAAAAIAERRLRDDATLSDVERAAQLDAVEARLPDDARAARQAATAPLRLADDERALREAGGSPADIQALRERVVGVEAAERLAALDQQRGAWQARVDAYRAERIAIDQDSGLDAAERAAAVAALRARRFSGPELLRIEALDRMDR